MRTLNMEVNFSFKDPSDAHSINLGLKMFDNTF